jgi:hypothetical protein
MPSGCSVRVTHPMTTLSRKFIGGGCKYSSHERIALPLTCLRAEGRFASPSGKVLLFGEWPWIRVKNYCHGLVHRQLSSSSTRKVAPASPIFNMSIRLPSETNRQSPCGNPYVFSKRKAMSCALASHRLLPKLHKLQPPPRFEVCLAG